MVTATARNRSATKCLNQWKLYSHTSCALNSDSPSTSMSMGAERREYRPNRELGRSYIYIYIYSLLSC